MRCCAIRGEIACRVEHQREDVGLRIELAERLEHPLAAAHSHQPVVDERDAHS